MSRIAALFTLGLFLTAGAQAAAPAPAQKCIFGESLSDLYDNTARFETKHDVIKTFKISRQKDAEKDSPIMVEVSIVKDKKTGRVFHVNQTFQDIYDGGNTIGWIEDVTNAERDGYGRNSTAGDLVAEIGDSDIYECTLTE